MVLAGILRSPASPSHAFLGGDYRVAGLDGAAHVILHLPEADEDFLPDRRHAERHGLHFGDVAHSRLSAAFPKFFWFASPRRLDFLNKFIQISALRCL